MTAARDQLHPTILKTRNRFVLNRARGFESHHLRQQKASAQAGAFFAAKMVRMRTGRRSADRKQSARCNDDDRCLWQKQGGVVGAAFWFFKALPRGCGKISKRNPLLLLSPRENIHHLRQQKASAQAGAFLCSPAIKKNVSIFFAQNLLKRIRKPDICVPPSSSETPLRYANRRL